MPDLKKKKKERKQRGSLVVTRRREDSGAAALGEKRREAQVHTARSRGRIRGRCRVPAAALRGPGRGHGPGLCPACRDAARGPGTRRSRAATRLPGQGGWQATFLSLCKGTVGITERSHARTRTQGFSHIFGFGVNFSRETLCAPGNISGKRAGQGNGQWPGTSCYKCI